VPSALARLQVGSPLHAAWRISLGAPRGPGDMFIFQRDQFLTTAAINIGRRARLSETLASGVVLLGRSSLNMISCISAVAL
jgi:hypothetical protein